MDAVINIREISKYIKAAGIKDDMLVYYRLTRGNQQAACMLRHCLIWSSGKKVQDRGGWFYKSDEDWAGETCFTRRKLNHSTKILAETVGLETEVRQIESRQKYFVGKTVTHYRIDPEKFWKSLNDALEKMAAGFRCVEPDDQSDMDDSDDDQCAECTEANVQNVHSGIPEMAGGECTDCPPGGEQNVHLNLSLDSISESPLQNEFQKINLSDERDYLLKLGNEFPDFEILEDALLEELLRLGRTRFNEVLTRCKKLGRTWAYVLKSLVNESAFSPSPSSAPPLLIESELDGMRYAQGEYADFIMS